MNIINSNLIYKKALTPLQLDKVFFIIIHHIDSKVATPEEIHKWHLERGWSGAGYNEYIRKDGNVHILRGDNVGAHCEGHNSDSYGIALEGNYDLEPIIPLDQYSSLIDRLKFHKKRFPNLKAIAPHKELYNTSCPGQYFNMINVLEDVGDKTENEKAVDNIIRAGITQSRQYWLDVLDSKAPIDLNNLRILFSRVRG